MIKRIGTQRIRLMLKSFSQVNKGEVIDYLIKNHKSMPRISFRYAIEKWIKKAIYILWSYNIILIYKLEVINGYLLYLLKWGIYKMLISRKTGKKYIQNKYERIIERYNPSMKSDIISFHYQNPRIIDGLIE